MANSFLVRYGEPGKYDHSPYGTICKVIKGVSDICHIYVQLSRDETDPSWSFVGAFDLDKDENILKTVNDILDKN